MQEPKKGDCRSKGTSEESWEEEDCPWREGDSVRITDEKLGRWSIKGTIASEICHEGAQNPSP